MTNQPKLLSEAELRDEIEDIARYLGANQAEMVSELLQQAQGSPASQKH